MQRPKHIREKGKAKVTAIVASNLTDMSTLKAEDKLLRGKQGYRVATDLRNGYVFTNPSNLGRRSQFGQDGVRYTHASPLPQGTGSWRK